MFRNDRGGVSVNRFLMTQISCNLGEIKGERLAVCGKIFDKQAGNAPMFLIVETARVAFGQGRLILR